VCRWQDDLNLLIVAAGQSELLLVVVGPTTDEAAGAEPGNIRRLVLKPPFCRS